jgi:hypothetical protein
MIPPGEHIYILYIWFLLASIYILYMIPPGEHGVCTLFLAGKSPTIRLYAEYIYSSGQRYACLILTGGPTPGLH